MPRGPATAPGTALQRAVCSRSEKDHLPSPHPAARVDPCCVSWLLLGSVAPTETRSGAHLGLLHPLCPAPAVRAPGHSPCSPVAPVELGHSAPRVADYAAAPNRT